MRGQSSAEPCRTVPNKVWQQCTATKYGNNVRQKRTAKMHVQLRRQYLGNVSSDLLETLTVFGPHLCSKSVKFLCKSDKPFPRNWCRKLAVHFCRTYPYPCSTQTHIQRLHLLTLQHAPRLQEVETPSYGSDPHHRYDSSLQDSWCWLSLAEPALGSLARLRPRDQHLHQQSRHHQVGQWTVQVKLCLHWQVWGGF